MERYRDFSGHSGVVAYELGPGSIIVQFKRGPAYLYTAASAGRTAIRTMQALATKGDGLSTYISQHIKKAYAAKLPRRK